jgi:hypothetical protein
MITPYVPLVLRENLKKVGNPRHKKSVGKEFVLARLGRVGQKCRLLAVEPTCRGHVGDFPSQDPHPITCSTVRLSLPDTPAPILVPLALAQCLFATCYMCRSFAYFAPCGEDSTNFQLACCILMHFQQGLPTT